MFTTGRLEQEFSIPSRAAIPPNEGVADAGWDTDEELRHPPTPRERSFHAGSNDDDAGILQACAFAEDAVDAGDAGVPDALNAVAHCFGGKRGLFCDGNVAGSGGADRDVTDSGLGLVAEHSDEFCRFVPLGIRIDVANVT